jgi:hypothetical protein
MKQKQKTKQVITFNSLHIEVLGPRPLSKSRATDGCVTDFLRTVEHDTRHLLRERAIISPELKGFRLRFDGR